jgi:catechol 2,3-dioxygenase-like lactoylglutathione lyase family enzyme
MNQTGKPSLELKVVISSRDFQASRRFYGEVLGLVVLESWEEGGGQGCIFGFDPEGHTGRIEVYEMNEGDRRFSPVFATPFENEKIELQLRTNDLQAWIAALQGVWDISGPQRLPWGERRITLRDPDNLLVAIFQSE